MTNTVNIRRGNVHVRYRLLLFVATACACAIGYLGARVLDDSRMNADFKATPGIADYQALANFNRYSLVRAKGSSMQPALAYNNFLLVRDTKQIQRGQILVSGHHGIHRVAGLPGETISLVGGRVQVCAPRRALPAECHLLVEPWVHYVAARPVNSKPVFLRNGYGTVPDNRACCDFIVFVPRNDVVGVVIGSLLSYGPLGPAGMSVPTGPLTPTLEYDPPGAAPATR
jgi:signal peptidase I